MEESVQSIRPEALSNEELLRYTYTLLEQPLPRTWALELYARLHKAELGDLPAEYNSLRIAFAKT
jgi:hypothetical protein